MPLTWDHSGPGINPSGLREPSSAGSSGHIPISQPEVTDRSQPFEPADFDAEGVRTIVTSAAYELRPRFTGRARALSQLHEMARKAFEQRELGFALLLGEPGMGKSRLINEVVSRVRVDHPTTRLFHGVADENS